MKGRDRLLAQEVPVIIANMMLGVGTIGLPSRLAEIAGPDGIIAFACAIGVLVAATVLIILLVRRFPNQGIADYSTILIGKVPGFIFNIIFGFFLTCVVATMVRGFSEVTKLFLLQRTPLEVIMISMLLAGSVLARNGLQPIARACQILLYLFLLPLLAIPFFIPIFETGEFLPLFQTDFMSMVKATFGALFALAGIEVMLVIGSHSEDPKQLMRSSVLTVIAVSVLTGILVVLAFGSLSVNQVAKLSDPLFEMIKYVPVPFGIFERVDIFFYTIWIAATYSSVVIGLFTASHHLAETFKLETGKGLVFPCAAASYFLALIPNHEAELGVYGDSLSLVWIILVFGVVPLFLLLSLFRKPKQSSTKKKQPQKRRANPG